LLLPGLLAAALLGGCAAPGARSSLPQASVAREVEALAAQSDSASLATGALLANVPAESVDASTAQWLAQRKLELAAHASLAAPANPIYAWIYLQLCRQTSGCDVGQGARSLREVDADNAAGWLTDLVEAQHRGDASALELTLQRMAAATRFDEYWVPVAVSVDAALSGDSTALPRPRPQQSAFELLATSIALANATIYPPFRELFDACTQPAPAPRHAYCLRLARTMERADTVLIQGFGFRLERGLLAPDSDEAADAARRQRVFEWRRSQTPNDQGRGSWSMNRLARHRLALMQQYSHEDDVMIALLKERRIALEPPASWAAPPSLGGR